MGRRRWLRRLFRRRRFVRRRRRLGELVMAISPEDRARIADAIREAEANNSGEIVCVLARSSSEYTAAPVLVGALGALVLPWALVLLTQWSVQRILVAQLILFVLVW